MYVPSPYFVPSPVPTQLHSANHSSQIFRGVTHKTSHNKSRGIGACSLLKHHSTYFPLTFMDVGVRSIRSYYCWLNIPLKRDLAPGLSLLPLRNVWAQVERNIHRISIKPVHCFYIFYAELLTPFFQHCYYLSLSSLPLIVSSLS